MQKLLLNMKQYKLQSMFLNRCIYLFYELCMSNIILIKQKFVLKFTFYFKLEFST